MQLFDLDKFKKNGFINIHFKELSVVWLTVSPTSWSEVVPGVAKLTLDTNARVQTNVDQVHSVFNFSHFYWVSGYNCVKSNPLLQVKLYCILEKKSDCLFSHQSTALSHCNTTCLWDRIPCWTYILKVLSRSWLVGLESVMLFTWSHSMTNI